MKDRTAAARAFFRAGGDMLLTVVPSDIPATVSATLTSYASDLPFKQAIDDAVGRVLQANEEAGLLPKSC